MQILTLAYYYRDLQEKALERGLIISHSTPFRWVQQYTPTLDNKMRPYLKQTNCSWYSDEAHIKIKTHWQLATNANYSELNI